MNLVRSEDRLDASEPDLEDAEVGEFLIRYGRALSAGDVQVIADLWNYPALVLSDEGLRAVSGREEVETFFTAAKADYAARGVASTRPDIVRLEWVTDRIAVVDVRWPCLDERGLERGEEWGTYTLRVDDNGDLKLCVALMRGASSETH
jgi:hypothetical protein